MSSPKDTPSTEQKSEPAKFLFTGFGEFRRENEELQAKLFGKPPHAFENSTGSSTNHKFTFGTRLSPCSICHSSQARGSPGLPNESQAKNGVDEEKLSAGSGTSGGTGKATGLFSQPQPSPSFGNSAGSSSSVGNSIFGTYLPLLTRQSYIFTSAGTPTGDGTSPSSSSALGENEATTNASRTTNIFSRPNFGEANSSTTSTTGSSLFGTRLHLPQRKVPDGLEAIQGHQMESGLKATLGNQTPRRLDFIGITKQRQLINGPEDKHFAFWCVFDFQREMLNLLNTGAFATQAKGDFNETKPSMGFGSFGGAASGNGTTDSPFGKTRTAGVFGAANTPTGAPGGGATTTRTESPFGHSGNLGFFSTKHATSNKTSAFGNNGSQASGRSTACPPYGFANGLPVTTGTLSPPYAVTKERDSDNTDLVEYRAITYMPVYRRMSFEELRTQDYQQGRKPFDFGRALGQIPPFAEVMLDGSIFSPSNQYFRFQSLVFQVENELFEVPDIIFSPSKRFKEIYPTLRPGAYIPLVLKDCTKKQFEAFLTMLMQPCSHILSDDHPCNVPPNLATLISALELTIKWEFRQLADDISTKIGPLITSDAQRIALGRKFSKVLWYRQGLENLIRSDDDIALEDTEDIGPIFTVRVYHARAKYRKEVQDTGVTGDTRSGASVATNIVNVMFLDELEKFAPLTTEPQPRPSENPKPGVSETSTTPEVGQTEPGVEGPATKSPETTSSDSPVGVNGDDTSEGRGTASSVHGTPSDAVSPQEPQGSKAPTNGQDNEQSNPKSGPADAPA
ncbi:hypothetical protein VNI00_003784 [Paramarasmius palmivorus]|uniref:Peptidase S59 domain-containing protein n=1 Tax=Paramarasmius palmivorus TaxID=297713 RepID=A0AAW0DN57_9AGAR